MTLIKCTIKEIIHRNRKAFIFVIDSRIFSIRLIFIIFDFSAIGEIVPKENSCERLLMFSDLQIKGIYN